MAKNKNQERFSSFTLLMPAGATIASGAPLLFGEIYTMAGVTIEAQDPANPPQDSNTGYLSVDFEGVYNLSVQGKVSASPSAGAAIKRGDPVFADGGTYDAVSGITRGFTLNANSGGAFFGLALDPVAAGATTTIRVVLKNAPLKD
jgi:Uncharacterized conserved protein (DUF2190)